MSKYQDIYLPCKLNRTDINVLFITDIFSMKRYKNVAKQIAQKYNFYAINIFYDDEFKMVLKRPNVKKWAIYVAQYIRDKAIDLSNTIIFSTYYACNIVPYLNDLLNNKIHRTIYVSPFVEINRKSKKSLLSLFNKDEESITYLYNNINDLKNDVEWIRTNRVESIVSHTNKNEIKRIINYFRLLHNRIIFTSMQKNLPYSLGLFLGENDVLINYKKTQKFFTSHNKNKVKVYPFLNSKLCCFEEEIFKFYDCLIDFVEKY